TEETQDRFYLAAVSEAGNLVGYATSLTLQFVVCLLVVMLLFMLLFRLGANRLDTQFEKLNAVVEQYAEGEFSARAVIPEQNELYPFACTLNRMAEFIEQNETTRKNFVANVSHELRTPMTTIGGFADGILDGTIPPEQHEKYTRIIADEIHRLRTLVNSMLNLSKFEAGEMQLRASQFDVGQLLIKTVLMFEKRITDKNVDVEGLESSSLQLTADQDLIFQVLYNLIENAVKFVNNGGIISFSVRSEKNTAYITVKNTGEGLADDELPKVFDRFYKTDASRSEDKTGLGLGLSIARKIVHLHEGHIVVRSVKGEYTAFEIQLPMKG
ncbi:MAG: HAMP domain-containing histidine kinase, partial [Oscillospiraceae bacterium]|nr:HAMP domain-containing histidine kinase [Oscillospiraceae bacterium]